MPMPIASATSTEVSKKTATSAPPLKQPASRPAGRLERPLGVMVLRLHQMINVERRVGPSHPPAARHRTKYLISRKSKVGRTAAKWTRPRSYSLPRIADVHSKRWRPSECLQSALHGFLRGCAHEACRQRRRGGLRSAVVYGGAYAFRGLVRLPDSENYSRFTSDFEEACDVGFRRPSMTRTARSVRKTNPQAALDRVHSSPFLRWTAELCRRRLIAE